MVRQPASGSAPQLEWLIWGAHGAGVAIFGFGGILIRFSGAAPAMGAAEEPVLPALLGVVPLQFLLLFCFAALVSAAFMLVGAPRLFARGKPFLVYLILRASFAEAVAIWGLVLFYLGASWLVFGAFLIGAWGLLAFIAPTARERQAHRRLCL